MTVLALALAAGSVAAQPGATPTGTPTTPKPPTTALPAATGTPATGTPATGTPTTGTPTTPTTGTPATGTPTTGAPTPGTTPTDPTDPNQTATADTVDPESMPVNLRLRRLEQRVQALKERAWRAKARTTQLKEAVIGGGVGAQATLVHENKMGSSFRLIRLVYALDGTQVFARSEDTSPNLYKTKSFDILTGPISPGSHSISALAVYRGHGYGVFKYLNKYTFTVRASHTFTAAEGKATRIEASGFEKGGRTTPLEKRPAIDFKVTAGTGEK
ncbi:MAG: hypothetical protein IPH44_40815 [Myxococcales bacterium]|nr:hypothetical protein [Myxococcales bacterium]MBP6842398.1 hypothetical protein [Kofleriaceae bacterium]